MGDDVTYDNIKDAIEHLEKEQEGTHKAIKTFSENFERFTGYTPDHRVNAFDVVRLLYKFREELVVDR